MNSWTRWRVPLGFILAGGYLFIARLSSGESFLLAVICVVAGCALRSWAAGHLLKGKRVAVGGPYAYIRNPLYVGSFIIGLGFCVALWSWPLPFRVLVLWLVFLVGFGAVYRAKTLTEERELNVHLGEAYRVYSGKVPAFLPIHGRVGGLGEAHFSGELYRRNREYQCVLGSLAMLIYLYIRWRYGF